MNEKVKRLKGEKVKGEGLKTAKMTAEQKACLAACKSFDADVERAEYIQDISSCVMRDRCKNCPQENECNGMSIACRMISIASVVVGMILDEKGGAK